MSGAHAAHIVIGALCLSCAGQGASDAGVTHPDELAVAAPAPASTESRGAPEETTESTDAAAAPTLPEGIAPGTLDIVDMPRSPRALRVIHGAPTSRLAIIYLHGMCGNIRAPEDWADVVSEYATLIALRGDLYCGMAGRFKWSRDLEALDRRIDKALVVVADRRGGLLDTRRVAVMGYSQGATRAAMLTQANPRKYPWVIAGGIPSEPRVDRIGLGEAIAVLGGEHEPTKHMIAGVRELERAGRNARYFHLPGAEHGQYGPEGARVLREVFDFVLPRAEAGSR